SGIDENAFMQRMSRYLFGGADQSAMQEKIRLVIGQVPIQMTSGKFYEKIKEALTLYKGSEKKSLDDFVYVLRTSGMLYEPKEKIDYYGTFAEDFQRLEEADYANLSESEYKELTDVLARTSAQIHALTDFYYSMQKVVNHIYTQCVLRPYQKEETKLDAACRSIWKCLSNGEYRPEMMIPLEGKIEKEVENVNQLESVLYEIKASYSKEMDEQGLRQSFDDLVTVSNLMSDSLFIDLNQMNDEELVDEAYVMQTAEKLIQEFSEKMKKTSRPLKRAIMGEVIEKLPMIFKSQQEVLDYIQNNLFGCQNKAEKCVVLSILDDLMREEEEWS
ncbi:MAG: hypothetical protein J5972_03665, partial [Eubacterium sp.]|nr:hypothetical protein [Eubacterium sp.]